MRVGSRKLRRDEKGFTGLEAAIVLIAFVVVAAVFSYVMLGAGFYTTQKSKRVVDTGVQQASSSLTLDGQYIYVDASKNHGGKTGSSGEVSTIYFYVTQTAGGSPVDLEKTSIAITTAEGYKQVFFSPLSEGDIVVINSSTNLDDGAVIDYTNGDEKTVSSISGKVAAGSTLIVKNGTSDLVNGTVSKIITVYLNSTNGYKIPAMGIIVVGTGTTGTLIVPKAWWYEWAVADGDNTVEVNEKYKIVLAVSTNSTIWGDFAALAKEAPWSGIGTISPNDEITVELRPPIGAPLTITKTMPPSFGNLNFV
ncbi:archaellin/type IV pilin N-terminal domain-containing protein [Archaeoglobus sp.]|uniref:archaellin/type IV pilin N-terminal domain-containing protein n=1 Tax=Archaeoglobus sp. TaxID=1872626 RepID=UPI0024ABAF15|nr:archaellin/type IV pilin N-terminal domain-containing protein [Archaeoglobus sp.]MDI3497515.1 archaeal flagellin FlaB [Archaeoglobus sp.]